MSLELHTHLLHDTLTLPFTSSHARCDPLTPPPRIQVHHGLAIRLRHDLDVLLYLERVIELPRWLRLPVLDIATLGVDAHLDARAALGRNLSGFVVWHERRVRVRYGGGQI